MKIPKAAPQQQSITRPQMSIGSKLRNHILIRMVNAKLQGCICIYIFQKVFLNVNWNGLQIMTNPWVAESPWPRLSLNTISNYTCLRMVDSLLISKDVQEEPGISNHTREKVINIYWGHFKRTTEPISYGFYWQKSRQFGYHKNNAINWNISHMFNSMHSQWH